MMKNLPFLEKTGDIIELKEKSYCSRNYEGSSALLTYCDCEVEADQLQDVYLFLFS